MQSLRVQIQTGVLSQIPMIVIVSFVLITLKGSFLLFFCPHISQKYVVMFNSSTECATFKTMTYDICFLVGVGNGLFIDLC